MFLPQTENQRRLALALKLPGGEAGGSLMNFNFNYPKSFTPPDTGASSIRVPLAARYIQTQSQVMPEIANGRVTFVIDYR